MQVEIIRMQTYRDHNCPSLSSLRLTHSRDSLTILLHGNVCWTAGQFDVQSGTTSKRVAAAGGDGGLPSAGVGEGHERPVGHREALAQEERSLVRSPRIMKA